MSSNHDRTDTSLSPMREILGDAIRCWEPRRLAYNGALALVVIGVALAHWPTLRGKLGVEDLLALFVLAVLANVCYCAAYLADIPLQCSTYSTSWRRRRWLLWLCGTLFGMALTWFWIADEVLPGFGR